MVRHTTINEPSIWIRHNKTGMVCLRTAFLWRWSTRLIGVVRSSHLLAMLTTKLGGVSLNSTQLTFAMIWTWASRIVTISRVCPLRLFGIIPVGTGLYWCCVDSNRKLRGASLKMNNIGFSVKELFVKLNKRHRCLTSIGSINNGFVLIRKSIKNIVN